MTQQEFMSAIVAFYRIQPHEIAQLVSAGELAAFRKDPLFFYRMASDELQDAIWNIAETKMPRRKIAMAAE